MLKVTKKTEVLRLTKSEASVISLIRSVGADKLTSEINSITNSETDCLKSLKDALTNKSYFTIKELIDNGTITEEDATKLISAYANKSNIVISGTFGSGKTTLLNALMQEEKDSDRYTMLLEKSAEIELKKVSKRTNVEHITSDTVGKNFIIKSMLSKNVDRLVIGEVTDIDSTINLLMALTYGVSALTILPTHQITDNLSLEDWDEKVKETFNSLTKGIKHPLAGQLADLHTVYVYCHCDRDGYTIKVKEKV